MQPVTRKEGRYRSMFASKLKKRRVKSGYEKSVDFAERVDSKRKFDIEVWKYGEI